MGLGGYLAPRAAAFNGRIDGVVAYDVFFDAGAAARRYLPSAALRLRRAGMTRILNLLIAAKRRFSPSCRWASANGMRTLGTASPLDTLDAPERYTRAPMASRIACDVLILAGSQDHFVPLPQVAEFERALVNARSAATRIYDRPSGGAEHCQLGVNSLWHADFFDWLTSRFGEGVPAPSEELSALRPVPNTPLGGAIAARPDGAAMAEGV
jgi:pimeloyl-ACP methyl ester carboxylesterase